MGAEAEHGFCYWDNCERLGIGDGEGLKMGGTSGWYGLGCIKSRG